MSTPGEIIAGIAQVAVEQADGRLDAVTEVVQRTDLTPHGAVEAARAVGDIMGEPLSERSLHDIAIKAAVNTLHSRYASITARTRRARILAMRESASAHIRALQAGSSDTEQHIDV